MTIIDEASSARRLDVRVLQIGFDPTRNAGDHFREVLDRIEAQEGADIVVLPEMWMHGAFTPETWRGSAIERDGDVLEAVGRSVRHSGAYVLAGSFAERAGANEAPPSGARGVWNTSVLFDRHGDVQAVYRKIHRFGFDEGEPRYIDAGDDIVVAPILDRDGRLLCTVGLATCYDLRFPELFRCLVDAGAEVLLVPAAWPFARLRHWQLLGIARAIENQVFVVQCNDGGSHSGVELAGHSQVVDPLGDVVASVQRGRAELSATIDLAQVERARAAFPVLNDRRFGLPTLVPDGAESCR